MTDSPEEFQSEDPATARDTVPIRPLRPWASRIFITLALLAAVALSVLAARMVRQMSDDESVQARYEAIEAMRAGSDSTSTEQPAAPDSTQMPTPADSTNVPAPADSTNLP